MDFFYEMNITEIKTEYTTFLINIVTPFLYEGIRSVYQFSLNAHKELIEKGKNDPEVKSPGILKLSRRKKGINRAITKSIIPDVRIAKII